MIVLEVQRPDPAICFIVTPYSEGFDELCQIIGSASDLAGLRPLQTRDLAQGTGFHDETYHWIRRATLVVVVYSLERVNATTNPNVVYELGLASSLRKPILILTNNAGRLPSDLRHLAVLEYSTAEVRSRELVNRVSLEMHKLKPHWSRNHLTDARSTDAWVSSFQDARYLEGSFWDRLRSVVKTTIATRFSMWTLYETVGLLKEQARHLADASPQGAAFQICEAWTKEEHQHRRQMVAATTEFFLAWDMFLNNLQLGEEGPGQASWRKVDGFYKSASETIRSLLAVHKGTDEIITPARDDISKIVHNWSVVSGKLVHLHAAIRDVGIEMDNLLEKLMDGMADGLKGIAIR